MPTFLAIICFGILSGLFAPRIYAQTFEDGYQPYMRNQYPVAEMLFKGALKKAKTKEDQAFILKFIGICQYMRGDKKLAAASFYQAVSFDRSITIDESEVLDPSVVKFFSFLKTKWIKDDQFASTSSPAPSHPDKAPNQSQAPPPAQAASTPPQGSKLPNAKALANAKAPAPKSALAAKAPPKAAASPQENASLFSPVYLLPFGAGQFYNRSYFLGSALAVFELGALYRFIDTEGKIKDRQDLEVQVSSNNELTEDQISSFAKENQDYTAKLKSDKLTALSLFAGIWAIGIAEAVFNAPAPEKSNPQAVSAASSQDSFLSKIQWGGTWFPNGNGQWLVQMKVALP